MCNAWRDEIEKLLLFAGLFSATVTAFSIESYKWLREDATEISARLLLQISNQLNVTANYLQTTPSTQVPFSSDPRSIRINVFWFLSLVLCL
ncbi:hypothetical protein AMATHDRAFT_148923 [Amanita thiersii Skay4041]|uniref:DUF6535 domain-containing protein n=1 Tax=Amanita thiersii Skay4041 TaxID=703135 RepID=A0A2A9NKS8_9AGAR|nr:hypothetical protein AMATHDRAFT_148923 [Amanita thiersii Skay4041]